VSVVERPVVGTPVAVKVAEGVFLPARVKSVTGDELVLEAPSVIGAVPRPELQDDLQLSWASTRGMQLVDARFLGAERQPEPVWRVALGAEAEVHQRRRYVRTPSEGAVCLTSQGGPQSIRIGRLLDVSEGGVRCRVPSSDASAGDWFSVRLTVEGEPVEVSGTLLRAEDAFDGFDEVVVAFPEDHPLAGRIRRFVMSEQRRLRREGLR
jgi:hypothetical protein